MKSYYRLLVEQMKDKAPDFSTFSTMVVLLKHANIEDVAVINEVVAELAGDTAQELHDGIREL